MARTAEKEEANMQDVRSAYLQGRMGQAAADREAAVVLLDASGVYYPPSRIARLTRQIRALPSQKRAELEGELEAIREARAELAARAQAALDELRGGL